MRVAQIKMPKACDICHCALETKGAHPKNEFFVSILLCGIKESVDWKSPTSYFGDVVLGCYTPSYELSLLGLGALYHEGVYRLDFALLWCRPTTK